MISLLPDISYPCQTHKLKIPGSGTGTTIFIHITEDVDGSILKVDANIAKAGSVDSAWAYGLSRMITVAIQHSSVDEVIAELSGIATDRVVMGASPDSCRSGPEAFAIALRENRRLKKG